MPPRTVRTAPDRRAAQRPIVRLDVLPGQISRRPGNQPGAEQPGQAAIAIAHAGAWQRRHPARVVAIVRRRRAASAAVAGAAPVRAAAGPARAVAVAFAGEHANPLEAARSLGTPRIRILVVDAALNARDAEPAAADRHID